MKELCKQASKSLPTLLRERRQALDTTAPVDFVDNVGYIAQCAFFRFVDDMRAFSEERFGAIGCVMSVVLIKRAARYTLQYADA